MRILLAGWFGMGNVGDDWLLEAAASQLRRHELGLLLEPGADVPQLADAPRLWWPGLREPAAARRFRAATRAWDCVVFCGGGWLAGDQGWRSPARWAARTGLLACPYVLASIGFGPFATAASLALGARVLRGAHGATVRSDGDAAWAARAGRATDVAGDLAFLSDENGPAEVVPRALRTRVRVVMPSPGEHWLAAGDVRRYVDSTLVVAERLAAASGAGFDFVSFQRPDDTAFWRRYGIESLEPATASEASALFADSSAVMAGRLHAGLLAAMLDVPVVGFRYHHKGDLMASLGVPVVDVQQLLTQDVPTPVCVGAAAASRRCRTSTSFHALLRAL